MNMNRQEAIDRLLSLRRRCWAGKDIYALTMAMAAIKEQERNAAPLPVEKLRAMDNCPVYVVQNEGENGWLFRHEGGFADFYGDWQPDDNYSWDTYGAEWACYLTRPETI